MSRKKSIKYTPFKLWESSSPNGYERRYIRLSNTQMVSKAMKSLSPSAFRVYVNMRLESAGKMEFQFPFHKYRSYMSRPTFIKAVKELEEKGFIETIEHNANLRKANKYRFSDAWKQYIPP